MKRLISLLKKNAWVYNITLMVLLVATLTIIAVLAMNFGTRHGSQLSVPELTGVELSEAQRLAEEEGLQIIVNDSLYVPMYEGGVVLDQLPKEGIKVKKGRKIYVTINSYNQRVEPIPYVAGRSLRQAKNTLEVAGFMIEELIYRADMATNYVLAQSYNGVQITEQSVVEAEIGSGVTLIVGAEPTAMSILTPQLIATTLREAQSRLWGVGLNVGEVHYDEEIDMLNQKSARVYRQEPQSQTAINLGRKVKLYLTIDETKLSEAVEAVKKRDEELAKAKIAAQRQAERADSVANALLESVKSSPSNQIQSLEQMPDKSEDKTQQLIDDFFN